MPVSHGGVSSGFHGSGKTDVNNLEGQGDKARNDIVDTGTQIGQIGSDLGELKNPFGSPGYKPNNPDVVVTQPTTDQGFFSTYSPPGSETAAQNNRFSNSPGYPPQASTNPYDENDPNNPYNQQGFLRYSRAA